MPAAGKAPSDDEAEPKGVFDKPIKVKGITILFGGFAKVDFIQDFDPIGNEDQFKVNTIPVEGDPDAELGGSTNISARQTRFTLDVQADESLDNCAGNGVLSPVPGVIGTMMAVECLKVLAGAPVSYSSVQLYDAAANEFRVVRLSKRAGCPVCSGQ